MGTELTTTVGGIGADCASINSKSHVYSLVGRMRRSKSAVLFVSSLAVFTDMLIFGAIIPVLPRILAQFGEVTDKRQSFLFVIYAVGLLIFTPLFGVMSDRLQNRQIPMLMGQIGLASCTLIFTFSTSFEQLLVARFLQGVAAAATWAVGMAMLADSFTGKKLDVAISTALSCHTLGYFLGPLAGGFLPSMFGLRSPFYLCTALVLIDLAARLLIKPPPPSGAKTIPTLVTDASCSEGSGSKQLHVQLEAVKIVGEKSGNDQANGDDVASSSSCKKSPKNTGVSMWTLLKTPDVILVNCAVILIASSFAVIEAFISEHLRTTFGLDELFTALCLLGFVLPNIIMASVVGHLSHRTSRYKIMASGLFLHMLVPPIIAGTKTLWIFVPASVYFGATSSLCMTPCMPELASIVDRLGGASYARVYAILNMSYSLGMIIGPLVVGFIKSATSFVLAAFALSIAFFLFAPFFFVKMRSIHLALALNSSPAAATSQSALLPE